MTSPGRSPLKPGVRSVSWPALVVLAASLHGVAPAQADAAENDGGDAPAWAVDVAEIVEGVTRVASPGVPGPLAVFGERAFPVVFAKDGERRVAVVAGARSRSGRAVLFGHGGYFGHEALAVGETDRLVLNAVRWCAGGRAKPTISCWRAAGVADVAEERGFVVKRHGDAPIEDVLRGADVVVFDSVRLKSREDAARISAWIDAGGGAVSAGLGWGYLATNRGKSLRDDHVGNAAFGPAGVVWADGYADDVAPPIAGTRALEPLHALIALDRLEAAAARPEGGHPKALAGLAAAVELAASAAPVDDRMFRPRMRAFLASANDVVPPSDSRPLHASSAAARLRVLVDRAAEDDAAPDSRRVDPSAADFPGPVSATTPRETKTFAPLKSTPGGWTSLGLYAPPGERIVVVVEPPEAARGRRVRIGAHTDLLWRSSTWRRHPDVSRVFDMADGTTVASSPFGGLVYVESPERGAVDVASCRVEGCVVSPHFVRGATSAETWRRAFETSSAPWGEIETEKIVLTAKTDVLQAVTDPEAVAAFWDGVLSLYEDLSGRPPPRRPWRVVNDVQISVGYMHAGYPIMTHLDVGPTMFDVEALRDDKKGWGFWHELGHNHQEADWTFDGTSETTCNVFTLRVVAEISGVGPMKALDRRGVLKAARAHLEAGAPFARWKDDPFISIVMYAQVIEAFGFDAMRRAFVAYRDAPSSERPRNDAEKRDRWLTRLSTATGRDLGPFFETWGVPVSESARRAVAHLPPWAPAPL